MTNPEAVVLVAGETIAVAGNGTVAVTGALDTITAAAFPFPCRPFTIFCRCRFVSAGEARVVVERPDGSALVAFDPIRLAGAGDAQQTHTITGLVFPAAGDYRIALVGAQGMLASLPLAVRLVS